MAKTGVIILAHGSRGERGTTEVPEILGRINEGLRLLLCPEVEIVGAALQFNRPDLEEATEVLVGRGVDQIVVAPYFLFFGRHVAEDIPRLVEGLRKTHPLIRFSITSNLGAHEYLTEVIARRIMDVCPGLRSPPASSYGSPDAIEKQSMEIVETILPPDLGGDERIVVRRMVHASGDPFIARLVKFSPSAICSGLEAVVAGRTICTDVKMVASGISGRLAQAFGCSVVCALDEIQSDGVNGGTRAARAINGLGRKLNGAIVAIGNAPTALLALVDMIDNEQIAPALVVGMPVGFVQARESKAELMRRQVPYITVEGTRGGSAMAAATVNALLRMAQK